MFGYFKRAWRGEARLWSVFWLLVVLGNMVAFKVVLYLEAVAVHHGILPSVQYIGKRGVPFLVPLYTPSEAFGFEFITYLPCSLICLRRNAKNTKTPLFESWARQSVGIITVLAALLFSLLFVGGGAMSPQPYF